MVSVSGKKTKATRTKDFDKGICSKYTRRDTRHLQNNQVYQHFYGVRCDVELEMKVELD